MVSCADGEGCGEQAPPWVRAKMQKEIEAGRWRGQDKSALGKSAAPAKPVPKPYGYGQYVEDKMRTTGGPLSCLACERCTLNNHLQARDTSLMIAKPLWSIFFGPEDKHVLLGNGACLTVRSCETIVGRNLCHQLLCCAACCRSGQTSVAGIVKKQR
jgi:hypothetical protein